MAAIALTRSKRGQEGRQELWGHWAATTVTGFDGQRGESASDRE